MSPETIAAYGGLIANAAILLAGIWAYLSQRAKLKEERDARLKAEAATAKKDELDALRLTIEALQSENSRLRSRVHELETELDELRGGRPRRHTGELKPIL